TPVEHASEPVERRVGIASAHGLVQRRDEVEVLLAALVVRREAMLKRLAGRGEIDSPARADEPGRRLEHAERPPRVAVGRDREELERVLVHREPGAAESALLVRERVLED